MAQFRTVTGPAYWASALVNGDTSSLSTEEIAQLNAWRKREGVANVVSCDEESRFTWHYALYCPEAGCAGGEVLDYLAELAA